MIPYEIYHMIHIFSLFVFFAFMTATLFGVQKKFVKILTGASTLLILISGMGLIARLGIPHGTAWPIWLYGKLGIWVILGVAGPIVAKRKPQYSMPLLAVMGILAVLQLYFVNYKPGS